jgi:hypothetical protein
MSFYGVEWHMQMGGLRFEVGFDSGAACGLEEREICVRERTPIERIPLASIPGRWLLDAYVGDDRETRTGAYTAAVAQVEADYARALAELAAASPAPPATATPSARKQGRRRRKEQRRPLQDTRRASLQRLEQTLTRDLAALGHERFDLQRLASHVTRLDGPRALRRFYFDEVNEPHLVNFIRKYATDAAYRADVDSGAAPWAKRNALFERNLCTASLLRLSGAELDAAQFALWQWMKRHTDAVLALPEYVRLQRLDSACAPTMQEVDPEIRLAVAAWNATPGVVTRSSCQGVSGVVTYEGRELLAVSHHEERAYIDFASMSAPAVEAVVDLAPAYPLVEVIEDVAFVRAGEERHGERRVHRLRSAHPSANVAFRQACADLAERAC